MARIAIILCLATFLGLAINPAVGSGVKVIALFANKAMLEVNGQKKIVKAGETFEGVLLKSASGRGAVVVIDGKETRLGMNQSIAGGYKKPERDRARIYPDSAGMYFADGKINGKPVRFLVDTGATDIAISGKTARKLKIDFRKGKTEFAETASSQRVPVFKIQLETVTVGGIRLRNVSAFVIPGEQPRDVLLGNSFLGRTEMRKSGTLLEIKRRY